MTTKANEMVREVDGRLVPAPGSYELDPSHSRADFVARHLMVTKVRGGFAEISGTIEVAEDPTRSTVTVELPTATINTGTPDRDAHLRSADFLDVENHPVMTFRSTSITPDGDRWKLEGDLTVRDITRPVTLAMEFLGVATDPWGKQRIAFTASGRLEREDWGLTWNVPLEGGGLLVSKSIDIDIEAQALPV